MIRKGTSSARFVSFLVLIVFIFLALTAGRYFPVSDAAIKAPLVKLPPVLSGILFVVLYAGVTFFLWFSKDVFRLAAAVAFGPLVSTFLVWTAEMVNCVILFHFARNTGKAYVETHLSERARGLYGRLSGAGFGWLLALRCAPLLPFRALDLSAGLSGMRFDRYFAAACIGSPLRIFWVQFVLAGAGTTVLKGPDAIRIYLAGHPEAMTVSLLYFAFMIAALLAVKRRERTCR